MNSEPLLIVGAIVAALEAAQVALAHNQIANAVIGAAIAGLGFVLARARVTPTQPQDGLP